MEATVSTSPGGSRCRPFEVPCGRYELAVMCTIHDRFAELAQLRFHDGLVGRSHAQQQLLPCGQRFELGVCVFEETLRLCQLDGALYVRRTKHVIDHLDQAIVEVLARVTQILVRLLEQGIQLEINVRERLGIRIAQSLLPSRPASMPGGS